VLDRTILINADTADVYRAQKEVTYIDSSNAAFTDSTVQPSGDVSMYVAPAGQTITAPLTDPNTVPQTQWVSMYGQNVYVVPGGHEAWTVDAANVTSHFTDDGVNVNVTDSNGNSTSIPIPDLESDGTAIGARYHARMLQLAL
jgi:hypothetical protein